MFNEDISRINNILADPWNVSFIWTTLIPFLWMGSQNHHYVKTLINYYESKAEGSLETSPFWQRLFRFKQCNFKDNESDTEDLIATVVTKKESNTQTDDVTVIKYAQCVGDGKVEERVEGWKNFFDVQNLVAILVIIIGFLYILHNQRLETERNNRGIFVKVVEKVLECLRNVYNFVNKKMELFQIK